MLFCQMKDLHNLSSEKGQEESSEGKFIQQKGRFQVTSADVAPKVNSLSNIKENQFCGAPTRPTLHVVSFLPFLQFCLQQNDMQKVFCRTSLGICITFRCFSVHFCYWQEQLIKLIRCLEQPSGLQAQAPDVGTSDWSQLCLSPSREKELQTYAAQLQQSITELSEELQRLKLETAQLERKINALKNKGN
ncbi:uncharacterized protein [Typha latifolia]|uniref:uncharacterized protein isoform X3 n=1 Tax=Typha latifolia TaxID=4733 RepID=UPI003C2B94CA